MQRATLWACALLVGASAPPSSAEEGATNEPAAASSGLVDAVLWTQQSIEHQAASLATYRAASNALRNAVKARGWASIERGPATTRRNAVVLDLDETVLDNTAYSAWLVTRHQPYTEASWQQWMALEQALAMPGSVAFVALAERSGVDVFFISNRECLPDASDPCPALTHTRRTLLNLGFAPAARPEALLLKGQTPAWISSDKSSRRNRVAQTHRIVMMLGDDMGDFLPVPNVQRLRAAMPDDETTRAMRLLGTRWFVIPNPMYGSWEERLPATPAERIQALKPAALALP